MIGQLLSCFPELHAEPERKWGSLSPMSGDNVHPSPSALEGGIDPRSDVFNRLLKNRVVLLGSDVNDEIANQLCAQLLYLEGEDPNSDIWLYINSPGGSVTAGMAITTRCSSFLVMWQLSASASPPRWASSC